MITIRKKAHYSQQKMSTRDYAYLEIKERIIIGELTPNEPIVEETLADELKISRTPLREALQRLEIEELVIRQMNGRLRVAPLSVQEVEEIFSIRSMLEGIVVEQATMKATARDINNLTHIVLMIEETFNTNHIDDILYYGGQFHTTIYELSGNKTAIKFLHQLNDHIQRYQRLIPMHDDDRLQRSIAEHKQILKYIKLKDKKSASLSMIAHIDNSLKSVVEAFENITMDL